MIESILKISEQGMSKPYLCKDDCGGIRWCKGNHTGVRSLICEWICARLAREIGLPIPAFEIFKLDAGLFNEWKLSHGESVPELVTESNQYAFEKEKERPGAFANLIRPRENVVRYGAVRVSLATDPAAELVRQYEDCVT